MNKYYLAYGMNTNLESMSKRCPNAISLGKVVLENHKLLFRTFCDVKPSPNQHIECALWSITPQCERSLDMLEGYPDFYGKKEVTVWHGNKKIKAMIYYMKDLHNLNPPSEYYLNTVVEGYYNHNMAITPIVDALEEFVRNRDHEHYCRN
jgi:gamma-glutamylcyclotransferase (GGCT)/AIG2-like uncharacterized protein YtfP